MTTSTRSIRATVIETAKDAHAGTALRKSHNNNYATLYVDPNGDLYWIESVDSNEGLYWIESVDSSEVQYRDGHAVPSLCRVGTGSVPCNCEWCSGEEAVESIDDIEFEGDEMSAMYDEFERQLSEIPVGYFDDEPDDIF